MKLILASASKGRKHLLNLLKIPYSIMPTEINEEKITGKTPLETIQLRAKLKAEKTAERIQNEALILAADTEVVINNQVIGKPKDEKEAIKILKLLSGKTHQVITAIYIASAKYQISKIKYQKQKLKIKKIWKDCDISRVTFKKITIGEIKRYLQLTDYTRYTGGYALLASPQDFVIRTEGSLSNIIGLPLEKVIPILTENGLML